MVPIAFALALVIPAQVTETATTCGDRIESSLRALEKTTPRRRAPAVLGIAAKQCRLLPDALRIAAGKASGLGAKARSPILADAARAFLPERCRLDRSDKSATKLAAACPLPPPLLATEQELGTLDQGTYAFGWVLLRELQRLGVRKDARTALFVNLSLATALELHGR